MSFVVLDCRPSLLSRSALSAALALSALAIGGCAQGSRGRGDAGTAGSRDASGPSIDGSVTDAGPTTGDGGPSAGDGGPTTSDGGPTTSDGGPTPDAGPCPVDGDGDGALAMSCPGGTDCDDGDPDVHPGATELCNGIDDDCSGAPDDGTGMECVMGSADTSCTTSCGTSGTASCTATCTLSTCTAVEVCNGMDDDCDGTPDNGFACVQGATSSCTTTCGSTGTQACDSSCALGACVPPAETCNGADDDCDGTPDNGFACVQGATSGCTVSACSGTATCSSTCTTGTCDLGPAPGNDSCSGSPTPITATGSYPFSTCGASASYGASCGSGAGSPDVVFRLDLASRSDVVLETTGATHDTVLHLHDGSCTGTELACDDDGGASLLSRISQTLDAGTYYVVVDGFGSSNQGAGTLSATITASGDECAAAMPITLGAGVTTVTGSTAAATDTTGSCSGSNDVWYSFTLSATEVVYINTFGSTYDTYLGMRDGSCGAANSSCTDDACGTLRSQIVRVLPAGTYYVMVDGFSTTSSGSYTLEIEHLPVGNNGASALPAGSSTQTGTTSGTGVVSDCRSGTAPERTYYWTQCPSAAGGAFSASTCSGTSYDSAIYLWSGATGGSVVCNDDSCGLQSSISATIPAGSGLFAFYVDGYSSSAGAYSAAVTRP